jgi:uncharacterized protein
VSTDLGIEGITEQDIADYLVNTPGFFDRHAELLSVIQLTSPYGKRAVSLQERQMQMLRDKHKALEMRIMDLIGHGQENLELSAKLHRFMCAVLSSDSTALVPSVVLSGLEQQFSIPQAALRLWGLGPQFQQLPVAARISEDAQMFANSLGKPYCGANTGFEACSWLVEPEAAASVALIPLRQPSIGKTLSESPQPAAFGLLVLGSPDATRYTEGMGLEFLVRLGELISSALSGLIDLNPVKA